MAPEPDAVPAGPPAAKGGRLDSWKEIADYLRRGLTTVQRWERQEALPVHRHVHSLGTSVFAYAGDLERWLAGREPSAASAQLHLPIPSACPESGGVYGGAMPLDSPYYLPRAADDECRRAIARRAAIVLVKGARQVGKSSLLARLLADARRHAVVAFTDSQALGFDDLQSPKAFYQALARGLAEQIRPASAIPQTWNDLESPNANFSRLVQRLLAAVPHHVVWGLDDVDRIVGREYWADVCGLFRSWHNLRALDPSAPWGRLTLVLAYGTECQLVLRDFPESSFSVGVRTTLADFGAEDVAQLNDLHGSPVECADGLDRLMAVVGGHPYLLQWAFDALRGGSSLAALEDGARREIGPLGEHLHRLRLLLRPDPALARALRAVLDDGACQDRDNFYRLRSAGIILGELPTQARPRCGMYRQL